MKINAAYRLILAETIQNYVQRLKNMGIKQVGSGVYGLVFQHPTLPDVVVKLLIEKDPDYLMWIKFCSKNQDNLYVPKIFNVAQDKSRFELERHYQGLSRLRDMHLIFMEKLKPVTPDEYKKFCTRTAELANKVMGRETFIWRHVCDNLLLWEAVSRQKEDLDLAKVAKFISKGPAKGLLDMHEPNIMKRGSQIVITDPFAS